MKVMLTGGTGFIGSHLLRHLLECGNTVHAIIRPQSRIQPREGLITHLHDGTAENLSEIVATAQPDVVIHLASYFLAQHQPTDVSPLITSNVLFPTQLLEAMAAHGVKRLVNTGTSWQHFRDASYDPVCLYAATKQAFEALLRFYVETAELRVITLKLFDTYGPDDMRPKLLHLLSRASHSGETLQMSPGEQLIDLVYIDDVLAAFVVAIKRLCDGLVSGMEDYAVSSGAPMSLREIVSLYERVTHRSLKVNWGGRSYRPREVMVPWRGGTHLPGWHARVAIEDGIARIEKTDVQD